MKSLETIPYKLSIGQTVVRINSKKDENERIRMLRNLFGMKESGIVCVSDLMQIVKLTPIHEIFWKLHTVDLRTEEAVFQYGNLLSFAEKCGVLKVDQVQRDMVNIQLEAIYKNFM